MVDVVYVLSYCCTAEEYDEPEVLGVYASLEAAIAKSTPEDDAAGWWPSTGSNEWRSRSGWWRVQMFAVEG